MKTNKLVRVSLFALILLLICAGSILFFNVGLGEKRQEAAAPVQTGTSTVYMTRDISPEGLQAVYEALDRRLPGKVAVKLSTGEPGGHHYLSADLIKDLVHSVKGTIVECNTAYGGDRFNTQWHKQVAVDHGFAAIARVDIMDEDGSMSLPFPNGAHVKEDFVGSHLKRYDSILVLSHFKGHAMGGFGGAIKNISIGIASSEGKVWIHSSGAQKTSARMAFASDHDSFLESMAEAAGAVIHYMKGDLLYINVMNNLSVDCDCDASPAKPELEDIGILASTDPVALDKACVDLVYAADEKRSASLRRRMESLNGIHTLNRAAELGLGNLTYQLVSVDD